MKRSLVAIGAAFVAGAVALSGVFIAQAGEEEPSHYRVEPSDTWQSIAASHGLTADDLQLANNIAASTSNTGHPRTGWVLHIPEVAPSTTTTTTTLPPTTTTTPSTTTTVPVTTAPPPTTTTTAPATTSSTSTSLPPEPSGDFLADFASAADFYGRFQLDVHFRDDANVDYGRVFGGDHDMACGAPTTQRDVHIHSSIDGANVNLANSELFWWCAPGGDAAKGHVMTGMADVDGYTILSFSPNQTFSNVGRVCWDVNATDLGGRKWVQALVIPEAAYQANSWRLDYISPTTSAVDQTALPLPAGSFMFQLWDHKIRTAVDNTERETDWFQWSTTDKAARYRHCMVDNDNGTVTVSRQVGVVNQDAPADPTDPTRGVRSVTVPGSFPANARVIFQDDNYTPEKDGPIAGFTWHWDNILVDVD
ncbi:MAG: hypothetical protein K0Q89_113 [Thermomicrobiales bacterium]|nr:hypothetical protein [Thermomicrobiales bacterium]